MIIVKNRELLIPNNERHIGTTYDTDTENRVFQVPRFSQRGVDLAALTFRLDIQYANEAFDTVLLDKEVGEAFIILIWRITSSTLQVPGTLYIGLRAIDDEATVKWSSFSAAMYVERHLNTPGNYGGSLTEIEQMEQDHVYMKGVVDELKSNLDYAHDAEAWAKGTRSGSAVPSTDPTYHKNSKYYSDQASTKATAAANSATAAANSATQAAETVADTNTRFNNAVAAVTSETEVIDARVGADGTQYTVLKNRLDAEHNQLKNHLEALEADVFDNDTVQPMALSSGTTMEGYYLRDAASTDAYLEFRTSTTQNVVYFKPADRTGILKVKSNISNVVSVAVAELENPVIDPTGGTFRVNIENGYTYTILTSTDWIELTIQKGKSVIITYATTSVSGLKIEGNFINQNILLSENVKAQIDVDAENDEILTNYTRNYYYYTDLENGNISNTGADANQQNNKTLRTIGRIPIRRKGANIYVKRDLTAIPSLSAFTFWFFDADGNGIPNEKNTSVYYNSDITESIAPPKNAVSFRYRISTTGTDNPDIDPSIAPQYINVWQPSAIGENLDENSVNWCAMGDSITYGYYSFMSGSSAQNTQHRSYGWAQIVAEMKNWNATNLGVGGTGYVRGSFTATGQKSAPRIAHDTDFSGYDLVTLAYGVNDWKGNRSLGSMADSPLTDAEIEAAESGAEIGNIYRNMKYVIEKIMSSNPNCKIVVITPINCGTYGDISTNWGIGYDLEYSGSLEDVFNAEKEICEYYGISYIDMTHSSVVNRLNMMTACLDGVHPTITTHRAMAHEIAARIGYR